MRLHDLRQPENSSQFVSSGRNAYSQQRIACLRGCNEVTDRADTTDACHERWHLGERSAFTELLEAAKLGDMQARIFHPSVLIQVQSDFGVTLDAGDRINHDRLALVHCDSYAPKRVLALKSGVRPSSNSLTAKKMTSGCGGHPGTNTSTGTISCTGRTQGKSRGTTWSGTPASNV